MSSTILVWGLIAISCVFMILFVLYMCSFCKKESDENLQTITDSEFHEPLVEVSPIVFSNSVIYQDQNHTPLLMPATEMPKNGPLVVDSKIAPLPGSIPFESADFPSVTPMAKSSEFPSVTPTSTPIDSSINTN